MVAVDPVASLRVTTTLVDVGGRMVEVGKHDAADWLEMIFDGKMHRIIPGWIDDPDDSQWILEQLLDGEISDDDLTTATQEALSVAGGRRYWWIYNLLGQAMGAWPQLNGTLVAKGVRAEGIPLAAWLDALYSICIDGMDQQQRIKFDTYVEVPPAGSEMEEIDEGEAFLQLMGSIQD